MDEDRIEKASFLSYLLAHRVVGHHLLFCQLRLGETQQFSDGRDAGRFPVKRRWPRHTLV
eukprot:11075678-Heterocapsa_arctica.AAC.1